MLGEFKAFIAKGNVVDMAVGIIIGAAFTAIVTSLVKDIINPIIGVVSGGLDFSEYYINLNPAKTFDNLSDAMKAGAPIIKIGMFANAVINFLIIAFVVFLLVKAVNRMKDKIIAKAAATPAAPTEEVLLLREIRDNLKK
jgi:large conductance mechanosensitive channel